MKIATLTLLAAAAVTALLAGCANPGRSRDLANPTVAAAVTAQQVCSNCHGIKGVSVSPNFPILAAQTEPYLVAQLTAFRSQGRHDPEGFEYMWGISRSLTDDQIKGLAAYYSSQSPAKEAIEGDHRRFDAGKAIFEKGIPTAGVPACASCHGDKGQGNDTFPRIAGQHADYLVKQLGVFKRTEERPEGAIMKTVAHNLTNKDIGDVSVYLQALPSL